MSTTPPPRDAVRAAAGRLLGGWLRRYRGVAAGVAVFVVVVAALPSTSPNASAPAPSSFASGRSSAPVAAGGSVAGSALTAPPDTAASSSYAPVETTPSTDVAAAPAPDDGSVHAPAPSEPPPIPGAPACPVPLPPTDPPPEGAPQLFAFFPLAGPFGAEALAGLPLLGHFLVVVTPLLPLFQGGLDASQPTFAQLVPVITQLESIVLGPAAPFIEQQTPQWLDYERQLVHVVEPIAVMVTDNPAVTCVSQLEVLAVAKLAPQPSAGS